MPIVVTYVTSLRLLGSNYTFLNENLPEVVNFSVEKKTMLWMSSSSGAA